MNDMISRSGLVDLLKTLMGQGRSSTVYVRTDDNHLIAIGVEGGAIVSLMAGPRQGERALAAVQKMRTGTYKIEPGGALQRRGGLPSSDEVLTRIAEGGADAAGPDCHLIQGTLCKLLVTYLGPIAPLVCQQAVAAAGPISSGEQVRGVIDALAREIEVPAEAERFRAQASRELAHALS